MKRQSTQNKSLHKAYENVIDFVAGIDKKVNLILEDQIEEYSKSVVNEILETQAFCN